ncbi:MAG: GYF domain-containing protein [Muribaculaceae bacterium]|nr:GYF domain-containing protein [Muribaculaceae bacterium]
MWYIIFNGQQVGPLDRHQLLNYNLTPASMVWKEGMPDWQPAGNVAELQDLLTSAAHRQTGEYPKYAPGADYTQQGPEYHNPGYDPYYRPSGKKIAAGVLAILLGYLGVQYFYLGKVGAGFITILLSIVTCGLWEVVTFIQGIVMLTMSDQEFDRKFVYTKSTFPLF